MAGILKNSSLTNREEMLAQMQQMNQPNPQQQQMQQQAVMMDMAAKQAEVEKTKAETEQIKVETMVAPDIAKAKIVSALSNNLNEDNEGADFEKRARIAELILKEKDLSIKEKDIDSNERIARDQMAASRADKAEEQRYMQAVGS